MDCWVNLNAEGVRHLQGCRQCQKTSACVSLQESDGRQEQRSPWESDDGWADQDRCLPESLSARIAEGTTVTAASVGVREDTERVHVPACCHTWKCVGKTVGPCVAMLCMDMDTVHGCCKTTGLPLFCSKKVCCTRSAEWSQEVEKAKTYQIGAKSKFVFNLQAVLYYCCVFNLIVNYPMIVITPCNWYWKNAQFSNRMTSHYSPESTVCNTQVQKVS